MIEFNVIQINTLRKIVRADFITGQLFWLERFADVFIDELYLSEQAIKQFNSIRAGKEAFTTKNTDGYKRGTIVYQKYSAHRVIWALHKEVWPTFQIDHKNRIRHDNRIVNLREATPTQNMQNQTMMANNTSGFNGVSWAKQPQKWQVSIMVSGKFHHLGLFSKKSDAIAARKTANIRYGFSENHGT